MNVFENNQPINFQQNVFVDNKTHLTWYQISNDNVDFHKDCFDELKNWSDDLSVRKYVASRISLDKLFRDFVKRNCGDLSSQSGVFFCKEDEKFVGVSMVSSPFGLNKHSTIDYVIVDPSLRNKGIATRMIKSILSKPKFFANGDIGHGFISSVETKNISSQKAFLKNHFKVVKRRWSSGRIFNVMYFGKRQNEIDFNVGIDFSQE